MKDSLIANRALLFILLIIAFKYGLSRYSVLYTDISDLFKIEVLFILLYTLIHQNLPDKAITNNRFVIFGLLAWIAVISARYVIIDRDLFADGWPYVYSIFHAIFFIYAFDVIYKSRADELWENKYFFIKKITRQNVLLTVLCVLTFSVAITSGQYVYANMDMILKLELIFILTYVFVNKSGPDLSKIFNNHKVTFVLMAAWFFVVTIALLGSPYDESLSRGLSRYYQTFFHAVFFMFVYQLLLELRNKAGSIILLMVPLSAVVLAVIFVVIWHGLDVNQTVNWNIYPPLNANIRHTGYMVTAATSIAIVFMLYPGKIGGRDALYFLLLLVSSAFVFWTGGRSSAISIFSVLILISIYLLYVKGLSLSRFVMVCATLLLGIFLADLFKVFDWNGLSIFSQKSDIEKLGIDGVLNGRMEIWLTAIDSLKNHWIFGLGPEGYVMMPNWIFGVQPHNLFIQFAVEWGVLGALIFLILMYRTGLSIFGSIRDRVASFSLLSSVAVLIGLTVHGLVDGTYYHGQPSYYIALALAVCLSSIELEHRSERA